MKATQLAMPWAPGKKGYCLPGSIVVKMALGEAPETIPASVDVRRGRLAAAQSLDGGVIDRIVNHFAGNIRVTRVHTEAARILQPDARHHYFNDREHILGLARTFRIDVPLGTPIGSLVDSLNQIQTVETAMPNHICVTPFGSTLPIEKDIDLTPWQIIHADEALAYEPGDPAVIVAIIDTGIAFQHPELAGRLRSGFDTVQLGKSDLALGLELLGDSMGVDTNPIDRFVGHGMGCAGIIGALGQFMPPGLAGDTQILPIRALGAARFPGKTQAVGIGATSDLDMAMKMAVDLGAKVINMSFGTDDSALDPGAPKPHADVVAYALERGCILVAASGNNGSESLYWPAAFRGVIAAGSVDAEARPSNFSTRGDHVALCAPGERILTLSLNGYQYATGTSFAAPFTAATAALLVARALKRSQSLDSLQVRRLLTESATLFSGSQVAGCGSGILNAFSALQALDVFINNSFLEDLVNDGED